MSFGYIYSIFHGIVLKNISFIKLYDITIKNSRIIIIKLNISLILLNNNFSSNFKDLKAVKFLLTLNVADEY